MNTRQQDIVNLVEKHGEITIHELAVQLKVSEMTIHRDLDYLQQEKYLFKKRGAASFLENPYCSKNGFYLEEKRSIGKKLASMIKPGQSILFDNSTTALECARFLAPSSNLTFYTTSPQTTKLLSSHPNSILYCSGGYYFRDSTGYIGKQAEDFVASLHVDVCVIGASGIDVNGGITIPYPLHTALQQKIIASADLCLLGADHSKFGRIAMEKVADLSDIDIIITDSGLSKEQLNLYRNYTKIIIS